jgi:hypothetical protein
MDPIGALIGLAILIAVAAIVARPLLFGPSSDWGVGRFVAHRSEAARRMDERARLLERRVAIYTALRELDFDHETDKVSDAEHARQRAELVEDGVAVLRQLDRLEAAQAGADPIEAAISALRRGQETPATAGLAVALEAAIGDLRTGPAANGGQRLCPACGAPAAHGDSFCANCGAALEMACAECGTPYQAGDLFCAQCGAALEAQG